MAELFRWISDYAKEKYGSSFVVNANLDADAASYFPDMGKYIDGGYFQNAFWNWNGNGENYPDGAGSRGEPFDFLLQQGIQPLYMDHIGTGPRDLFPWLEDFDAKATTAKYLETFGHAIDRAALPYIAPLLFGKPYAMAPRYARVDSAGLHAGTVYRDWVIGSAGNDKISGGDGADLLAGLAGNDRLDGGSGIDTAYYARSGAGVAVSLGAGTASGEGRDTLVLIENVIGSNFVDVIRGSTGKNRLEGGDGDDRLYGLAGSDTLLGGAGNDRLFGGDGQDILTGGAGKDIFIFDSVPAFRDTISDFSKAAGEKIQLSKSVFTAFTYTGTPKSDDFHAAAGATAAEDASDRIVYNKTSGILYYDADGVGGVAPVEIAMIGVKTHADLAASDFMIIA
jgi:hypothetical protein